MDSSVSLCSTLSLGKVNGKARTASMQYAGAGLITHSGVHELYASHRVYSFQSGSEMHEDVLIARCNIRRLVSISFSQHQQTVCSRLDL